VGKGGELPVTEGKRTAMHGKGPGTPGSPVPATGKKVAPPASNANVYVGRKKKGDVKRRGKLQKNYPQTTSEKNNGGRYRGMGDGFPKAG